MENLTQVCTALYLIYIFAKNKSPIFYPTLFLQLFPSGKNEPKIEQFQGLYSSNVQFLSFSAKIIIRLGQQFVNWSLSKGFLSTLAGNPQWACSGPLPEPYRLQGTCFSPFLKACQLGLPYRQTFYLHGLQIFLFPGIFPDTSQLLECLRLICRFLTTTSLFPPNCGVYQL